LILPSPDVIAAQVGQSLAEDLGSGDLTATLVPADDQAVATVIAREAGVLSGQAWFAEVFHQIDRRIQIEWRLNDGDTCRPDAVLCELAGPARALLSGERAALNWLQTLSATATATARYVRAVAGTRARVLDTRKTLPGLRVAQKYAVTCGGGHNHRMGLFDAILIKENHIEAAGGIAPVLAEALRLANGSPVEIEVENLDQLQQALDAGAQHLLLDNFTLEKLKAAVALTADRARLEASGGVNLNSIAAIAQTGVDDISVGELTKDLKALDLSMRFIESTPS
jgi:nicotinate-nucleotide pyrophosphorylase (carboxylating)